MMNQAQARVVDPILSTFARGYQQNELIAKKLFPEVFVDASGGQVIEFGKEAFMLYDTLRAPGANGKRIDVGFTGKHYALENHSLDAKTPIEVMRNAQAVPGIDLLQENVGAVLDAILLKFESQASKLATDATQYAASNKAALTGAAQWSASTSTPKKDAQAARAAIRAKTGKYPNLMILPPKAIAILDQHPEIRDRLKYTGGGNATAEMLARYFEVDEVVEGNAVFAASLDADFSDVWGNNVIFAYVARGGFSRGIRTPSFGSTYTMRGNPFVEAAWYDRNCRSWINGVNYERAPVIAGAGAGFLLQNVF